MKRTLSYLTAGLFALALATAAQAQAIDPTTTVIRVTGSTAYRGATVTAISNVFDGGAFTVGFVGSSFTGAVAANFRGAIGGVDVLVKTSWSGSEAGLQTVSFGALPLSVKFLPDDATRGTGTPGTGGGQGGLTDPTAANGASTTFKAEIPDIAMSDSFQEKSEFFNDFKGKTYPALQESPNSPVGVVPFKFVVSKTGAASAIDNITSQLAKNLFSAGRVQLSLFTGVPIVAADPNDANRKFVFAAGRDPDSGTRLTALAETGLGASASVKQYQPTDGSNAVITTAGGAVVSNIPWPASVVNTIPVIQFNGGYNSGGKLAAAMGNTSDTMANKGPDGSALTGDAATGGFFLTYLSTGDATTAISGGAKELKYNGVTYSTNALTQGQYTFWGYEHLFYRTSADAKVVAVGDKIALQLLNTDATVKVSSMKVSRTTDGDKVQ